MKWGGEARQSRDTCWVGGEKYGEKLGLAGG